jgi:alkylhydroperoxidase family enzyme
MSTTPRLPSAVPAEAPVFPATIFPFQPEMYDKFREFYAAFWNNGVVDHMTKETARIRNARVIGCGKCRNIRFDRARAEGLSEDLVELIDDDYERSDLPARGKLAIGLVDDFHALNRPGAQERAQLRAEFSEPGVVELAVGVALFTAFAKVLIVLGCEPEQMETTIVPTPDAQYDWRTRREQKAHAS